MGELKLRPGTPEDAEACGTICFEAFKTIAEAHRFAPDFPGPEIAIGLMHWLLSHPGVYSVVAELDGCVVGSNFLDERNSIAGVGPITVAPDAQNRAVGRRLMTDVIERTAARNFRGVRLLQSGYHGRSLSLYAKLGFDVRESVTCLQGAAINFAMPDCAVRAATEANIPEMNRICERVHGHDRDGEVQDAIKQGSAMVVERDGRITGYTTTIAFFGHTVGETNDDLKALIGAAKEFGGPGFLLPLRNGELFRWCLERGLRVIQPLNVMSKGFYQEPAGAFLPSIWY